MSIQFPTRMPTVMKPAVSRAQASNTTQMLRFRGFDEEGNWKNERFDKISKKVGDKVKGGAALAGGVIAWTQMPTFLTVLTLGWAPVVVGAPLVVYGLWKLGAPQYLAKKGAKAIGNAIVGNAFKSNKKD